MAPAEGFVTILCGGQDPAGCRAPVQAPLGPDFWHTATSAVIRSKAGVRCGCGFVTWEIGEGDFVSSDAMLAWLLGPMLGHDASRPGQPEPIAVEDMPPLN